MTRMLRLAMVAILAGACADTPDATHHDAHVGDAAPRAEGLLPAREGMSIYQLDGVWQNQNGEQMALADLQGRPQLVALVYTHCAYACPLVVADMKQTEVADGSVGFVLVSIDPERDTPERLREFASGTRMGSRWTLLAGGDDELLELAAVLGVRYRRVSETDFMHSNAIVLLDGDGNVVYRQEGYGDTKGTLAALKALSSHHVH